MVLVVNGIFVGTSVGADVVALAGFADVAIENDLAIDGNGDVVADGTNLLSVPGAELGELDTLGGDDAIDGAVLLVLAQIAVVGGIVVENLNLHALVGSIDVHRGADANAVVDTQHHELELEAVDEVAVLLLRVEVATVAIGGIHVDGAVDEGIVVEVALPVVHVRTVEQHDKALLLLLGRELADERGTLGRQFFNHALDFIHRIAGIGVRGHLGAEDILSLHEGSLHGITAHGFGTLGDDGLDGCCGSLLAVGVVEVLDSEVERRRHRHVTQRLDVAVADGGGGVEVDGVTEVAELADRGEVGRVDERQGTVEGGVGANPLGCQLEEAVDDGGIIYLQQRVEGGVGTRALVAVHEGVDGIGIAHLSQQGVVEGLVRSLREALGDTLVLLCGRQGCKSALHGVLKHHTLVARGFLSQISQKGEVIRTNHTAEGGVGSIADSIVAGAEQLEHLSLGSSNTARTNQGQRGSLHIGILAKGSHKGIVGLTVETGKSRHSIVIETRAKHGDKGIQRLIASDDTGSMHGGLTDDVGLLAGDVRGHPRSLAGLLTGTEPAQHIGDGIGTSLLSLLGNLGTDGIVSQRTDVEQGSIAHLDVGVLEVLI